MNIRQKGEAIRITMDDSGRPQNIDYLLIEPARCWQATFNAWGKKADTPVVHVGSRRFKVILEEIT